MCEALHCKPGDIIDWMDDDEYLEAFGRLPDQDWASPENWARLIPEMCIC